MVNHGPSIEPPTVTVLDIDDPWMAGAGLDLFDMDAMQLQSMPLRVRRVVVRLEARTVVCHSTGARVRTRTIVWQASAAALAATAKNVHFNGIEIVVRQVLTANEPRRRPEGRRRG